MNIGRDQINIENFKGNLYTGTINSQNNNEEMDGIKSKSGSSKSINEKMQQKNAAIEQILDKWGFRPSSISFGKREEKKADIEKWLRCFEPSELGDALLILENIQYHDANMVSAYIERLSKEIKKIFGDDLTKVKFFPLGESPSSSGGNFLYMYRKELGLSEASFPYTPIDETDFSDTIALVFFDDMIGSGNQALTFAKQHLQNITIDKYYVSLLAFKEGYEKVKQSKYFKNVIVHEMLSDEYRAFSPNSQLFPDIETRKRIKILCEKYGRLLFPKHPLGYDNSQALIVFFHNTPNNTLPIIWASDRNEAEPGHIWYPVWERIKNDMKKSSGLTKTDFVISQKTMPKESDAPKLSNITEDRKISIILQELLTSKLSLEELRDFCFEINIDYENIGGETKSGKIRELLIHLERRNKLEIIKLWLKTKRPDIWNKMSQKYDEIMKTPTREGGEAGELPEISSQANKVLKKEKPITKIEITKSNNVQVSIGNDNYQVQSSNLPHNKGLKNNRNIPPVTGKIIDTLTEIEHKPSKELIELEEKQIEERLLVSGNWKIERINGDIACVSNGRISGLTPIRNHDISYKCHCCGNYGPWDGTRCLSCGRMDDPTQ
jgi:hypothetical protein